MIMNTNASIWMKKVQRFSLMLLLSGLILVQFMQMASASHFSFDDQMTNSGSALEQDHKGHHDLLQANDAHDGHNKVCEMTLCQAIFAFGSAVPSSLMTLMAADRIAFDGPMFNGPFLPQIGKPPKHI